MTLEPPPRHLMVTIVAQPPMLGSIIRPQAEINGYPIGLQWGANALHLPPGVYSVKVYMSWFWRYGAAEVTVDNRGYPSPTVYYAPPWVTFLPGAIGFNPVKGPGLAALLGGVVVPLLIFAFCIGASVIGD